MSIPLVQNNEKDSINTSIIAIKRNIERINMLLGLVDSGSPDLSGLATKQELEDAITQVETELAPVDEVTVDNMHSVTSSGVYNALNVATRVEPISGLFIYKIGRFCYFEMSKAVSGTSPIEFGLKLPQGYIPQGSSCRFTYINNITDMPEGQLGFYTDGNIRMYKGGGGTINCVAKCNGVYLSTT